MTSTAARRPAPSAPTVAIAAYARTARIVAQSADTDEDYEGCLSFYDVRGLVIRPLTLHLEHQNLDGQYTATVFPHGLARLVAHEIGHLRGLLYTDRMHPGLAPV